MFAVIVQAVCFFYGLAYEMGLCFYLCSFLSILVVSLFFPVKVLDKLEFVGVS